MRLKFKFLMFLAVLMIVGTTKSWAYDDWTSPTTANSSSSSNTWTITVTAGQYIGFDWTVSSEEYCDWLTVTANGTEILKKSGTGYGGSFAYYCESSGTVTFVATYSKNSYYSSGNDNCSIKNIVVGSGTSTFTLSYTSFATGIGQKKTITAKNKEVSINNKRYGTTTTPTWTSSNPNVATVSSSGVVTGVSAGTAIITATNNGMTATCEVTVFADGTLYMYINKRSLNIEGTANLYAYIAPSSSSSNSSCTWTTSNQNVATVNSSGVVTGVSAGTAIITAANNGKTATCTVTVTNQYDLFTNPGTIKFDTITLAREGTLGGEALKLHSNLSDFEGLVVKGNFDSYDWNTLSEMTSLKALDLTDVVDDAYPSTSINTNVKAVKLSKWIDEMNNGNPFNSSNLSYMYVPDNVKTLSGKIHSYGNIFVLGGCEGVETIGSKAFENHYSYDNLYLVNNSRQSNGVSSSYHYNSSSNSSSGIYGNLSFPKLKTLGESAFTCCENIKSFSAPLLESVPDYAFNNSNIESANLPSVKSIGQNAFSPCRSTIYPRGSEYNIIRDENVHHCLKTINIPLVESIGANAFAFQDCLSTVEMPNLTSINAGTFFNCKNLKSINAPRITSVGSNAFYNCDSLKSVTMTKITTVNDSAFAYCSSLEEIKLPVVTSLAAGAFKGCSSAKNLELSDKLTTFGSQAFYGCSSLETITLPASITSIPSNCFAGSNSIKTISCNAPAPPSTGSTPFSMQTVYTAKLYVPSSSIGLYQSDTYWKHFYYYYTNPDVVTDLIVSSNLELGEVRLDKLNLTINAGSSIAMSGTKSQAFKSVLFKANSSASGMFLSESSKITSDATSIDLDMSAGSWYFVSLPFSTTISDIVNSESAQIAIYKYDGAKRASSGTGSSWTRVSSGTLTAGTGYIIQVSKATTLTFPATYATKDTPFKSASVTTSLAANTSSTTANQGWNFVGNPYATYFDIAQIDYSSPITVWNGSTYTAYSITDDELALKPLQPFFVQCPTGVTSLTFNADGRQTTSTISHTAATSAKAKVSAALNRKVVDVTVSDEATADRTRIVINGNATDDYDITCDAAKMMSMDSNVPQLYSWNGENQYAINEGPQTAGEVALGFVAPKDGTYTIKATRSDVNVKLIDTVAGETINLTSDGYTFESEAGTFNGRFKIVIDNASTTGINAVANDSNAEYYDVAGRKLNTPVNGVNIIRKNGVSSKRIVK